jgi:hypothetical protein
MPTFTPLSCINDRLSSTDFYSVHTSAAWWNRCLEQGTDGKPPPLRTRRRPPPFVICAAGHFAGSLPVLAVVP